MRKLLGKANTKTMKGEAKGYMTFIMHLAPHKLSGYQVCPNAVNCIAPCLNSAGRGKFNSVQLARINKTKYFFEDRDAFMLDLYKSVRWAIGHAKRKGFIPVIRLNGTSDIAWEKIRAGEFRNIFEAFPDITFYDYTKIPNRKTPKNYNLTFSYDGLNGPSARDALDNGQNVAVVFDSLPIEFIGHRVVNGDESDLRFLDPKGVIIGLKAKGGAKNDFSGFVVRQIA